VEVQSQAVKFAKENVGISNAQFAEDVYRYWMQKRTRLRKPLLRRYWPATAVNDTNPHMVFRPREKERCVGACRRGATCRRGVTCRRGAVAHCRYKLRKHRKNDMEAYEKMKQLRDELDSARSLVADLRQRERLKKELLVVGGDIFEQVRSRRLELLFLVLFVRVVRCALLCCAVLCCAVLCCAVLCCAVLCCAAVCCVCVRHVRVCGLSLLCRSGMKRQPSRENSTPCHE
jgi:hypothetical protein